MCKTSILLALALLLQGAAFGELICEELPVEMCSLSTASSGKRCLLETSSRRSEGLECKTSEVIATNLRGHIESDECVNACGVHRTSIGISSDSLLEREFAHKLCSPQCYDNCPNIVDLYNNLAQAEGVFLPELCKNEGMSSRRVMVQLQSSGAAAYGPISDMSQLQSSGAAAYGPISEMSQLQSSGAAAYSPISAAAEAPTTAITYSSADCAPTSM